MDYWQRKRMKNIILIVLLVLVAGYGCFKAYTSLIANSVTIKYVESRRGLHIKKRSSYGDTSSQDPAVVKEWLDLMDEIDRKDLRTDDRALDPNDPVFPCLLVEFRLGKLEKFSMVVTVNKVVVSHWLWGSHIVDYSPQNPYYYEIRDRFAVMTTGESWKR